MTERGFESGFARRRQARTQPSRRFRSTAPLAAPLRLPPLVSSCTSSPPAGKPLLPLLNLGPHQAGTSFAFSYMLSQAFLGPSRTTTLGRVCEWVGGGGGERRKGGGGAIQGEGIGILEFF